MLMMSLLLVAVYCFLFGDCCFLVCCFVFVVWCCLIAACCWGCGCGGGGGLWLVTCDSLFACLLALLFDNVAILFQSACFVDCVHVCFSIFLLKFACVTTAC